VNATELFSSSQRVELLRYAIFKNGILSVNKTANERQLSNGLVSHFFNILSGQHIMKKVDNKFVVDDTAQTRAIKIFLTVTSIDPSIFHKYEFVRGAGIYGSSARGTNTEDSDIDLWVYVGEASDEQIASMMADIRKNYPVVSLLVLSRRRLTTLKTSEDPFYYSLIFGSVLIYGDSLESTGL
jgi:predicted nucleotidyltransferase